MGMALIQDPVVGFSWPTAVDLSNKAVRARLSPAAIKGIIKIAEHWGIKDGDTRALLNGVSNGTLYNLKSGSTQILDQDQLTRVSLLVGMYKALNILYSKKLADSWMKLPNTNPIFNGDTPLNHVKKGGIPALQAVRQLLDARRGAK